MIPIGLFVVVGGMMVVVGGKENALLGFITLVFGLVYGGLGILQLFAGLAIRRLENWARLTIGILSIFGLLGIPIGTLISGYFLYLCFSQKGTYVCSPEYHRIVANTPHIQYKTSIVVWILLGLFLLLTFLGIVGILFFEG